MVVHHDVYLPPSKLAPLRSQSITPIGLQAIHDPVAHDGASQSFSQPRWRSESLTHPHSQGSSSSLKRRVSQAFDVGEGDAYVEVSRFGEGQDEASRVGPEPGPSRRRSGRLSQLKPPVATEGGGDTTALPFAHASALDQSDSYLSLNTTTSNPSQLPLTADQTGIDGNTSISNLPTWHIPLSKLNSLHTLLDSGPRRSSRPSRGPRRQVTQHTEDGLVNLIVCVTSIDPPVQRQRKEEKVKGKEGTLWISKWSVVVPPDNALRPIRESGQGGAGSGSSAEDEAGCEVKLWDGCCREWGNGRVRRGDIVLLQGVQFKHATSKEKAHLVLSSTVTHSPKISVLYRTLPRYASSISDYQLPTTTRSGRFNSRDQYVSRGLSHASMPPRRGRMHPEDRALRPDLRLGRSDAGVRKVAEVARWFAEWVGGDAPP